MYKTTQLKGNYFKKPARKILTPIEFLNFPRNLTSCKREHCAGKGFSGGFISNDFALVLTT